MRRIRQWLRGGSEGNEQLTAIVAIALVILLVAEGATLLSLNSLLTVHAFIGMLLIPVVALKFASTGWRALRYYRHAPEYVRRGPPHPFLRAIVAPIVVLSTIVLFGTGVLLLAADQTHGAIAGLHKASFFVWVGATGIHVLAHLARMPVLLRLNPPGRALRLGVVAGALVAGLLLATVTFPAADHLQDHVTGFASIDAS